MLRDYLTGILVVDKASFTYKQSIVIPDIQIKPNLFLKINNNFSHISFMQMYHITDRSTILRLNSNKVMKVDEKIQKIVQIDRNMLLLLSRTNL